MQLKMSLCMSLTFVVLTFPLQTDPLNTDKLLNPSGWNLPDVTKMVLEKVETISLPGIPDNLVAEYWRYRRDSPYRITNLWRKEQVLGLTIYKGPSDKILCFRYARVLEGRAKGSTLGILITLNSDLDGDGSYEFEICGGSEGANEKLLNSILRIKLGLSEETELVRRIIGSMLREMGNSKVEPYK